MTERERENDSKCVTEGRVTKTDSRIDDGVGGGWGGGGDTGGSCMMGKVV